MTVRLRPVGFIPLDDPHRATACLTEALDLGIQAALWLPHGVPTDKSPTHPDYDGVWPRSGGVRRPHGPALRRQWQHPDGARRTTTTGGDPGKDFVGGGENVRSKDFLNIFHDAENLLTCMVLDGTFGQFPGLRCGVIELGGGWVPNLLALARPCGAGVRSQRTRTGEAPASTPSDYIRRQVRFTPWHFEDFRRLADRPPAAPSCSCSPRTGPTPRAGGIRSASSRRRSPCRGRPGGPPAV